MIVDHLPILPVVLPLLAAPFCIILKNRISSYKLNPKFFIDCFKTISEGIKKFKKVNIYKPPSSRKDSKENFIICQNLR